MEKNIHQLVEETLKSIDGIKPVEANPFFATRFNARLDKHLQPQGFVLPFRRPVLVLATLLLLLIMNVALLSSSGKEQTTSSSNNSANTSLQNFANEYSLNTSTNY